MSTGIALLSLAGAFHDPATQPGARQRQRRAVETAIEQLKRLPCRCDFSSLAVMMASCGEARAAVDLVTSPPAPQTDDLFHYGFALRRLTSDYAWIYDRPRY